MSSSAVSSWPAFAGLFLRIGALGFGGPQAHVALLRDEIVENKQWVDPEQFDEGLGLCEALPGPISSQMAIYLGWLHRGWVGGIVGGTCFLLPGLLSVLVLSELWRKGQTMPSFTSTLQILQPVIAAIIWSFAWKLVSQRNAPWQIATAVLVMAGMLLSLFAAVPLPVGLLLLLAGLSRLVTTQRTRSDGNHEARVILPPLLLALPLPWLSGLTNQASAQATGLMASLFSVFFKAGLLVFGGGLVIIPLLERQVVERGWLNASGFLDGVAIGQISPGPVVLTCSFVGYQAGWAEGDLPSALLGATAATLGIFLPSFLFILVGTPILRRLRQQPPVQTFLAGLTAGVPGAVGGAALPLTLTALQTGAPLIQLPLFVAALSLSISDRMKPLPLIGITLLIGVLYGWLR